MVKHQSSRPGLEFPGKASRVHVTTLQVICLTGMILVAFPPVDAINAVWRSLILAAMGVLLAVTYYLDRRARFRPHQPPRWHLDKDNQATKPRFCPPSIGSE